MAAISHRELYQRLINLDLMSIMEECVTETEDTFNNLNREQLRHGIDARGDSMPRYKSAKYAKMKRDMGSIAGGRVDLLLTGDFFKSFHLNPIEMAAVPTPSDHKTEMLVKMYPSNDFLGLNDESMREYRGVLHPLYIQKLSQKTGLQAK